MGRAMANQEECDLMMTESNGDSFGFRAAAEHLGYGRAAYSAK
ncbi:hypothetical protein QF047_004151 [Arthrobacter sp. W4I7]|nr:hypothetical protein [Arthrobacter sp. W4I7]